MDDFKKNVLFPEEKILFIIKGTLKDSEIGHMKGLLCLTDRHLCVYAPKHKKVVDYSLENIKDASFTKSVFSGKVSITTAQGSAVLERLPKSDVERLTYLIKSASNSRKTFIESRKAKGLVNYGLRKELWGTSQEAMRWMGFYLKNRGYVNYQGKWTTKEEYFEEQQKSKGLYKYLEKGFEKWRTLEDIIAHISPREFEEMISKFFSCMGFHIKLGPYVRDFGADIIAKKGEDKVLVQVKKYETGHHVGAPDVQRTLGSMWKHKANKSILVTTSDFTEEAKEQAREAPIELWNWNKLKDKMINYLPASLITKEKILTKRDLYLVEQLFRKIAMQAMEKAPPQIAMRFKLKIEKSDIRAFLSTSQLEISTSGPIEYVRYMEETLVESLPLINEPAKTVFNKYLHLIRKKELEYITNL